MHPLLPTTTVHQGNLVIWYVACFYFLPPTHALTYQACRPVHVQVQAAPLVASCGTSLVPHLPVNPTSPRLPTAQFLLACRCRVRHLVPRACSKIWWHLCFCGARHGSVATGIVVWCGAGFLGAYMVPWCWHGSVVAGMVLLCRASLCAPRYGSVVASSICCGTHGSKGPDMHPWCDACFCGDGMVLWWQACFCGAMHAFVAQNTDRVCA